MGVYILGGNHVTMSANWFGIDPNTEKPSATAWTGNFYINANDVLVGGETRAEGNFFVCEDYTRESRVSGYDPRTGSNAVPVDKCLFKNNTIGYKTAGTTGIADYVAFDYIDQLDIIDNIYNYGSITHIEYMNGVVNIKSNKTNLDRNLQPDVNSSSTTPFELIYVKKAIIGGPDPADANNINNIIYRNSDYAAIDAYQCNDILIQRNSISCKSTGNAYNVRNPASPIPNISITTVANGTIKGTATPGATVEVFSDSECQLCEPTHFIGSVVADNTGAWQFTSNLQSTGFTASASLNGRTSVFAKVGFDISQAVIKNPSCGNNNGSIKGIAVVNNTHVEWRNENGELKGTTVDIDNLPSGDYTFTAFLGEYCNVKSTVFSLRDTKPVFDDSYLQITNSCDNNGSITGLGFKNQNDFSIKTTKWYNQNQQEFGQSLYLTDVPSGNYTLKVITSDNCVESYGPVTVKSLTGIIINQTNPNIQPTNCGQSTGAIKNIIITGGTGNIKYSWLNAQHQEVANTNDLTGQPAGMYTLKVTDDSQCGPVYSSEIEIPEVNGITLDENNVVRSPTTCSQNNGSIKGITAPGATHYKWINTANNNTAGSGIDLPNAAAGNYQLIASNDFGCSKTSQVYTIEATPATIYPTYSAYIVKSCAGQSSGSISLITDNLVKSMRWIDATGQPAGSDANPHDLKPGTYKVYFTDANGCETLYPHDFTVDDIPALQINGNSIVQTNDQCGLKAGSIKNIQVTGGTPPYTYLWVDEAGNHLSTSKDLTGVGEGTYSLQVHDSGSSICSPSAGIAFNISNQNSTIDAPVINPLQLCAPGEALLTVNSPAAGNKYRLYNSLTDPTYLDEQTNGIFKISANVNSIFYISQVNGQCESERATAQITISLSAIDIPNTFTPNGDGNNDYWKINNAQNYPQAIVQVFTRYGQKVFESKGYGIPFDGTYKGSKLPAGVYYYILNLGKSCNLLSGSLTIIR
ncbi:gliding motility-associated C-terminal domain-containing protein [Mucilaginibacter sp. SMC90]|uniref:gliding motility-associated C-terminal domain-containing protein n=1 Tax=Mucilaginibacter sp. SMC90 TaxID=2929803 RepID=UPI001FB56C39|nr:gliding motility-associated C-terminal domain-containing protein [Mucilaginibacter sp. SMC90]UOE50492.1 gliding motility-associated C-terminal domain-containing protein [Mucilaginibacter sp. SMC90]